MRTYVCLSIRESQYDVLDKYERDLTPAIKKIITDITSSEIYIF